LTFWRWNLGPKAVISAALLIAVNTALVVGAGYWSLTRDFDARAQRDIDFNLRTLSLAFGEDFQGAKVKLRDGVVDRIEMAEMPAVSDHKLVDRATSYVGGTATVFAYEETSRQFIRRSTNLKSDEFSVSF
jgi:methyl-accepting chemotaxis protein